MDDQGFRKWLEGKGQAPNTVSTRIADAKRVERHYGDLDAAFEKDRFATILEDLTYSTADKAAGKPNSSRLEIDGDTYNSLASYLTSRRRFCALGRLFVHPKGPPPASANVHPFRQGAAVRSSR